MSSGFLSATGALECALCAVLAQECPPHSTCLRQGGSVVIARRKLHVGGGAVEFGPPRLRGELTQHIITHESSHCFRTLSLTLLILCREIWVQGAQCIACSNGTRFDASKSSTFTQLGESIQLDYGSSSIVADLANETISMGVFKSEREVWCDHRILHCLFSPNGICHCLALLTLSSDDLHCVTNATRVSSGNGIRHPWSWLSRFVEDAQYRSVVDSSHSRRPTWPRPNFVCLLAL